MQCVPNILVASTGILELRQIQALLRQQYIDQGEMPDFVDLAAQRIQEEEATKRVVFFGVGVEGADIPILSEIVVRTPMRLRGLNFNELFVWLSRSMLAVSESTVGDQVALQPPGWTAVD